MINNIVFNVKVNVILALIQPGSTLDIGCGDKRYTNHMPDSIGIDNAKEFKSQRNYPDYLMDAQDLKFDNETFDNVCILDTLEHIPDTEIVVKQVWRVLKPNGIMVIVDPNDNTLFWSRLFTGRIKHAINGNPDHIHKFNRQKLQDKLDRLFQLEKVIRRGIFTGYRFRRIEIGD